MSGSDGGLGRRLREAVYGSPLHSWRISGTAPDSLAVSVGDAWPGEADAGRGILEGMFPVDGQSIQAGANPWTSDQLTPTIAASLHRFDWLRDLRDLGGDAARLRARDLVSSWLQSHQNWSRLAWQADILGARLAAWIGTYAFFADSADDAFRAALLGSVAKQLRHLSHALGSLPEGAGRFDALKGGVIAAVALGEPKDRLEALMARLEAAVRVQILPDGGHISRAPQLQVRVLAALVDIRAALRAGSATESPDLDDPIQRMTGVLRMLRHGDGGLVLLNGAVEDGIWGTDALLARTESKSKALISASDVGFERMAAGRMVLIADCGAPSNHDGLAHAGTLGFELSVGKQRLIVNCGSSPAEPRWDGALRASAAHSTVTIDDTNSSEMKNDGSVGRKPREVRTERWDADGAAWLEAEHDGYVELFGLSHRRRIYMAPGGDDVRGEDLLSYSGAPGEKPAFATARFHLHPRLASSLVQNGSAVLLRTTTGAGWRFRASGGTLDLSDSVYFGQGGQMQRTTQITLTIPLDGIREAGSISAKWALRREDKRGGPT
jgi:uncharacterized heparinase superfamily protein